MRRHFYVYDFWNIEGMENVQKADANKYAIVKYSYKQYPVFIVSEDDTLSEYLAELQNATDAVKNFLVELHPNDAVIGEYYKDVEDYDVIGNEKMLRQPRM